MESTLAGGLVAVGLLVALVAFVTSRPRSPGARARSARERQAALQARRVGAGTASPLTVEDVRRLAAFGRRIPDLHGEPTGARTLRQRWAAARRRGVVPWAAASGVGAFSMATHFIVLWLGLGGGWAGAVVVTVGATAVMVGICLAIVYRLGSRG